jgi:hypothetical protein
MTTLLQELTSFSRGAEFVRADLHIHSFGQHGSHDVTDATLTPTAIVDTARAEGLGIVSITDHNEIRNVEAAAEYAADKAIVIVPGVELSTPQGHLLAYLPSLNALRKFYGSLSISADRSTCAQTIELCLDKLKELGGFGIPAHVDLSTGMEGMMTRFDPFKERVLSHEALVALEISSLHAEPWYTERDDSQDRKRLLGLRAQKLGEPEGYEVPRVMGSDAHTLAALGRNARGDRKLTRIKIDSNSFDAVRIALQDAGARVRIEDLVPPDIPHFVGMKMSGGFLDGQLIHFSRNLTCIIGGRGTGKSTAIESLRCAAGHNAREGLVDSDVWPDSIDLLYKDQSGRIQHFARSKYYSMANVTDPTDGITMVPIESYGQGETAETIQHCDKEPTILLSFLDTFIDLDQLKRHDADAREELLKNQTEIERLQLAVNTIGDIQKAKANAEAQLKALKEKDAAAIVDLEEKLARGKRFKTELVDSLTKLFKGHREALADNSVAELLTGLDGSGLVVGSEEFGRVKILIDAYTDDIKHAADSVKKASTDTISAIKKELQQWAVKEADVQTKIDGIRKELEARGIKLDVAYIRKIAKDVTDFTATLTELKNKEVVLKRFQETRRQLLTQRREIKSRIFVVRRAFADQINENLRATVVDYTVTVRFDEGTLSQELEAIIQHEMSWRTSQVPRAALIARFFSPLALLNLLDKQDVAALASLRTDDGTPAFNSSDARAILETLARYPARWAIERCDFEDRPDITVTKEVELSGGKKQYLKRLFAKLSLGQQQSVLLSILLFSKSNDPLVIDQPEDNLDSEFIYKTFVRTLRKVKETRQVIVVTHNANIAVLGDAELIIPLRATSERSVVRDRGSIDNAQTKELTCTILEGSREAFTKRRIMYGH